MSRITGAGLLLCCFTITGCLPSSCKRVESRELFAADSLSRELAAQIPQDTLALSGLYYGPEDEPLEYPRTIMFDSDGLLWVGDVAKGRVIALNGDGVPVFEIPAHFELPFIVGMSLDTTFVFDAAENSISSVRDTVVSRSAVLSGYDVPEESVRYASLTDRGYVLKVVPKEGQAKLVFYDHHGRNTSVVDLPGASWQWAGFLRKTAYTTVSLRGYQPRIDTFDESGRRDSLNLVGFDSPMLARMRSYMSGNTTAPPLLTPSASFLSDRLFVLNIRPGWTRVDVYDQTGRLTDVLIREKPSFNKDYFPTDIAVRQLSEQSFLIAVAYVEPEGRIETYEWTDNSN